MPLYQQLADTLIEQIRANHYELGARIPSEHELAAEYGLGRPTVRQATEQLVRRGVLERRRGSGTFVREAAPEVDLFSLDGTLASFQRSGIPLRTRILEKLQLRLIAKDDDNPFSGRTVYWLERLGSVRRKPVLMERIYFDPDVFPKLDQNDVSAASLSRLVEQRYGLQPQTNRQTFRVVLAGQDAGKALRVTENTPVLLVKRTLDFHSAPAAVFAELFCLTDEFVFAQTIREIGRA